MLNKRGMDLSINAIVIIILALLVLIVMILIFTGASSDFLGFVKQQLGIGKTLANETGFIK